MTLIARIFVVIAAISLVIAIILRLARIVFPVAELAPVAFLRFTDTSLLFAVALMLIDMATSKARS